MISKEINKQMIEENTGINVQTLDMQLLNVEKNKYDNILNISKCQSSIIFDYEDSYKYMIIENKSLDSPVPVATNISSHSIRKRQA